MPYGKCFVINLTHLLTSGSTGFFTVFICPGKLAGYVSLYKVNVVFDFFFSKCFEDVMGILLGFFFDL